MHLIEQTFNGSESCHWSKLMRSCSCWVSFCRQNSQYNLQNTASPSATVILLWCYRTSTLQTRIWPASCRGRFTPRERATGTRWIGDWVGTRADLDNVGRGKILPLPELELRPLGRPASCYTDYPGPFFRITEEKNENRIDSLSRGNMVSLSYALHYLQIITYLYVRYCTVTLLNAWISPKDHQV
jgi:hypothetical protein